ncbi:MAG: SH3 domain-containing protein [Alphaproteobacteria bacterium]
MIFFRLSLVLFSIGSGTVCAKSDGTFLFYNLRYGETNVRFGPSNNSPIKFSFKQSKLPVKVLKSHQEWYLIRDMEGERGWVLQRMVSPAGFVLVINNSFLRKDKNIKSRPIAHLTKGVIVKLEKCHSQLCRVQIPGPSSQLMGWMPEKHLWGINPNKP